MWQYWNIDTGMWDMVQERWNGALNSRRELKGINAYRIESFEGNKHTVVVWDVSLNPADFDTGRMVCVSNERKTTQELRLVTVFRTQYSYAGAQPTGFPNHCKSQWQYQVPTGWRNFDEKGNTTTLTELGKNNLSFKWKHTYYNPKTDRECHTTYTVDVQHLEQTSNDRCKTVRNIRMVAVVPGELRSTRWQNRLAADAAELFGSPSASPTARPERG